jgi:hypothetical protein
MRYSPAVTLVVVLGLAGACDDRRAPDMSSRSAPRQGEPRAATSTGPERPMAQRREAQDLLDSARTALAAGDTAATATLLHRAAAFFRIQANAPPSAGTSELLASAAALDAYATQLTKGAPAGPSPLNRLSARANLAEAERHGAVASVAWSTNSKESVSDELTMAADHVERAASDGRLVLRPRMRHVLAEIRTIATVLPSQRERDVQSLDEPLASLQIEIQALQRELARS